MDDVLVSVLCAAYNHEKYIRKSIESFLMQKTDFKYEIIIHDDASTDHTAEIIKEYEKKYPEIIHGIYEKENQYSRMVELIYSLIQESCNGKYVAICEGDDFWLASHKLQTQIDYMEREQKCVLSVHNAVMVNEEKCEIEAMMPYEYECDISPDELIMQYRGILPTASMVFRRDVLDADLNSFFSKAGAVSDYPLQLYLMTKGKIHHFNNIMSVYRYMHHYSWSKNIVSSLKNTVIHTVQMLWFLNEYNNYTNKAYKESIFKRKERFEKTALLMYQQQYALEYFDKYCDNLDMEMDYIYYREFLDKKEYFHRTFGVKSSDLLKDIRAFISNFHHVYIMGAGKFAGIIAEQLRYSNVDFEGFVVSDSMANPEIYLNKPVYELDHMPCDIENSGIIVGINLKKWTDVIDSLNSAGIKKYLISSILYGLIELEIN